NLDPEAVEAASRVILHVSKIARIHELTMGVQGRKHALHCRSDEIVIARLVFIHVILPEQFQSLCENGNLRVAVIFFALSWLRFLCEHARKSAEHETSQQRDNNRAPHIQPKIRNSLTIAHEEILATRNRNHCLKWKSTNDESLCWCH